MENVHVRKASQAGPASQLMSSAKGVEVSWVHNSKKNPKAGANDAKPPSMSTRPLPSPKDNTLSALPPPPNPPQVPDSRSRSSSLAYSAPATANATVRSTPPSSNGRPSSRRPSLLKGTSSGGNHKSSDDRPGSKRSTSWIANISNKFSSQSPAADRSTPPPQNPSQASPQPNGHPAHNSNAITPPAERAEEVESYVPSKIKDSTSFFSSLTRKLSAGSQTTGIPKVQGKGGICERRVLNVDPNRTRCYVPEMDISRLRKVSFCVDVEIASGPRYIEDDEEGEEDEAARNKRKKDARLKERAEGEALKRPATMVDEKNAKDEAHSEAQSQAGARDTSIDGKRPTAQKIDDEDPSHGDTNTTDRKKEKKKRSEEERKERKEKRRRRAEENGQVPVELSGDGDASDSADNAAPPVPPHHKTRPQPVNGAPPTAADARRDRPTTDPVRIYRRCCQLRETPILKRITEQLMSPTCCVPAEPGVVHCLDLTGSRLQLADMVTLGDWLAVVPVKKLLLEDADVNDEGLRCILAGLLAAKRPEPTRRKNVAPRHREGAKSRPYQERAGKIERLVLKNNPRISRTGWKHICLFLYMCRSIKAVDLSMIRFPDTLPPSAHSTPVKGPQPPPRGNPKDSDAAETIFKCLSERMGGGRLQELLLGECGLNAAQIRKIVDGAAMCGISRLSLAGNHLDDEGLQHVLRYLRSGVCSGLDLGSNDLRGSLGHIAAAIDLQARTPFSAISLAGCNLNSDDVQALFPTLRKIPDFRFIDLSHNRDLCENDNDTISLLRRYIGQMKGLKRIHLSDVGLSPKQAIALADVLPEGPKLNHLSILENPQLTALANAKDGANQEEAIALYASLMAAVRVSNALISIDIDVPSPENSEIVKALAKQLVAYALRNMEQMATDEAAVAPGAAANAASALTQPYGGEERVKAVPVPEVLLHMVGYPNGRPETHTNDEPAPDDDYIVGGAGVVKALQYVLGEKSDDLRRRSLPSTPTRARPSSSTGFDAAQRGKAKKMSKDLLESARKIRHRLQPSLVREATSGDETAYRRLLLMDQTLQSMIHRFEEEYPETRLVQTSPPQPASTTSSLNEPTPLAINTSVGDQSKTSVSDEEDEFFDDGGLKSGLSRHNSDVSLASRALGIEEGQLHRIGHRMRRTMIDSPAVEKPFDRAQEEKRLKALQEKVESITGDQWKSLVELNGWEGALEKVGANMQDLRQLQEQDPKAWEEFQESQLKARLNTDPGGRV